MNPIHLGLASIAATSALVLGVAVSAAGSGALEPAALSSGVCADAPAAPGTSTGVGNETLDASQIANAAVISAVAASLNIPARGAVIAVATAMQESRLRNLNHGDRDSVGLFQQRTAWGPLSERLDPVAAARMFFTGGRGGQPGLLDIDGWQSLPLTQAAQAVQRSGFPDAYAQWEPIANQLVATATGTADGCVVDDGIDIPGDITANLPDGYTLPAGTPPAAGIAISWAAAQLGTPYHYGGSCTAPHSGIPARQCDCSSLVQQAYRHAGITLPRTTKEQIHAGAPIYDTRSLRAGDLLFLPGHVGIYLGYGLVLHAPKTGDVVKISKVQGYWLSNLTGMRRVS